MVHIHICRKHACCSKHSCGLPSSSKSGAWVAGGHLQKGVHLVEADTELPPFFDTFEDFKEFCCEYRANLGRIVRLCACLLPEPALLSAHRRLSNALQICSTSSAAPQVHHLLSTLP